MCFKRKKQEQATAVTKKQQHTIQFILGIQIQKSRIDGNILTLSKAY